MRLVFIALAWAAGIVVADRLVALSLTAWLILVVGVAVMLWLNRDLRFFLILCLMFALGASRITLYPQTSAITAYHNTGGLSIEGVITADPDVRDDRVLLRVASDRVIRGGEDVQSSGLVLVQTTSLTSFHYGDRIRATGRLSIPAEYDTFSYADYLARSGIFSLMRNATVERLAVGQGDAFFTRLYGLREHAAQMIAAHLPEPQAGLLTGMLLGNERGISPALQDAFNSTGTAHIIAISGFNMAIISTVIAQLFRRIFRRRWIAGLAGIAIILIYTLLVGANAAVVRAAIMSSLLVIAELLRRKTYLPASLAFVVLLMSALNPTVLWDVSFQLSFFATLGLMLFTDPLKRGFDDLLRRFFSEPAAVRLHNILSESIIVTIAALIFTLPLSVMYFNRLSLVTLPVNLLVVPVQAALLLIGGAATLLAGVVPALAQALYWFCMVLLSWTIQVVRTAAQLPFASVNFSMDPRLVALFLILITGWAMMEAAQPVWWLAVVRLIRRQSTVSAALASGMMTALLVVGVAVSRPDGQLHVWFLDVGHSNAVFIQTPGGAQILVDGGRYPSRLLTAIGDRMPFNDREIELVVITTPDEYQLGALPAVLSRYSTGVVLTNGQPNQGEAFAELQTALSGRQTQVVTVGYSVEVDDGVRLEVLNPLHPPELGDDLNDQALVLRVTYGDVSFLLTGQISADSQQAMLETPETYPLATVLQLPRQGTIRSLDEAFLAAVQPSLVVVQADPANPFGDPDPDVLALLPPGIPLLRTDQDGTIHLWTDGRELWSQTERSRN